MGSTALRRARTWTVGIMSVSAITAALVGFHLAEDHSAALAAQRTTPTVTGQGTSQGSGAQDEQSDDEGSWFPERDESDESPSGAEDRQATRGESSSRSSQPSRSNQNGQTGAGFGSTTPLGSGSGPAQASSSGS